MLPAGVGSIALVSSPEQTEAGTPKHARRALVLIAARTAAGAAAESLVHTRALLNTGKPDRPQRGLGLPGSSSGR